MQCSLHSTHQDILESEHSMCIRHGHCLNSPQCSLSNYCPTQSNYSEIVKLKPSYVLEYEKESCENAIRQMEINMKIERNTDTFTHYSLILNKLYDLKGILSKAITDSVE